MQGKRLAEKASSHGNCRHVYSLLVGTAAVAATQHDSITAHDPSGPSTCILCSRPTARSSHSHAQRGKRAQPYVIGPATALGARGGPRGEGARRAVLATAPQPCLLAFGRLPPDEQRKKGERPRVQCAHLEGSARMRSLTVVSPVTLTCLRVTGSHRASSAKPWAHSNSFIVLWSLWLIVIRFLDAHFFLIKTRCIWQWTCLCWNEKSARIARSWWFVRRSYRDLLEVFTVNVNKWKGKYKAYKFDKKWTFGVILFF